MKTSKLIWIPRVLLIVLTLLILPLSFDVFEGNAPLAEKLLGLLMHLLIPFIPMLIILIIAWRKPLIGGILCIILGVGLGILFRVWNAFTPQGGENLFTLILVLLIAVIGILFIVFGKQGKKLAENPA
jgi:hypothetical protein